MSTRSWFFKDLRYALSLGFLFVLLFASQLQADHEIGVKVFETSVISPTAATIFTEIDPLFPDPTYIATWVGDESIEFQEVTNHIVLRFDPTNTFFQLSDHNAITAVIDVTSVDVDGNSTTTQVSLVVQLKRGRGESPKDQDYYNFTGGHKVTVDVVSITPAISTLPIRIDNIISIKRFIDFDANTSPTPASITATYLAPSDELEFNWTAIPGAVEYDLEWMHINNYGGADLPFNFRFNSTRVRTSSLSYQIPLIFEEGNVLFRYRGVGRGDANFTSIIPGAFSGPESGANVSSFSSGNKFLVGTAHEADLFNWQYLANYAEEGKHKASVTYFDGSMRHRQVVVKLNSEGQAIVAESFYDHQGREGIQVLPTPTGDPRIRFYPRYNRPFDDDSRSYNRSDFDEDKSGPLCDLDPKKMSDNKVTITGVTPPLVSTGSSRYYSTSNDDRNDQQGYIPNAGGFPFSHVEYTPDNTGRIRRQSAVGPEHLIGSDHETKYFYGKPTQKHLDRLFGSEIGYFSHYKKNAEVDANEQVTASYLDREGRVIATCLAGNKPSNLEQVASNIGTTPMTVSILDNKPRVTGSKTLESVFVYLALNTGTHTFDYHLTAEVLEECLPVDICYDCVYDLVIYITDDCGVLLSSSSGASLPIVTTIGTLTDLLCDDPAVVTDIQFDVDIPKVGNYTITKRLQVNEEALLFYTDNFLESCDTVLSLHDMIADDMAMTDFSLCDRADDCSKICVENLGTEAEYLIENPSGNYTLALAECELLCEFTDVCEGGFRAMLADFMPTGQYADFSKNEIIVDNEVVTVFSSTSSSSILTLDPSPGNSFGVDYTDFTYYNDDNTLAFVTLFNGAVVQPHLLSLEDFVHYFQPSWANSLVTTHPEFCYYEWCGTVNRQSDFYDDIMRRTDTYEEAFALGLLNPLGVTYIMVDDNIPEFIPIPNPADQDPFFLGPGATDKSAMISYMKSYTVTDGITNLTGNLWEIAAIAVECVEFKNCGGGTQALCGTAIANSGCYKFAPVSITDPCTRDRVWTMFKMLYLAEKQRLVDIARADFADNHAPACNNETIGISGTYFDKEIRFPRLDAIMASAGYTDIYGSPGTVTSIAQSVGGTATADWCNNQCSGYADTWMLKLIDCNPFADHGVDPWEPGNVVYDEIKAKLIAVCELGCDDSSPWGASSIDPTGPDVPSGITGVNDYQNFTDVIAGVLDAFNISTGLLDGTIDNSPGDSLSCNAELITFPYPYGHDYLSNQAGGNLDDCACDKILDIDKQFGDLQTASNLPFDVLTNLDLFRKVYGINKLADFNRTVCVCTDAFIDGGSDLESGTWTLGDTWNVTSLGLLEQSGEFVDMSIACTSCSDCTELQNLATAFRTAAVLAYGAIPADREAQYDLMLETHLNGTLNFDLTIAEYKEFLEECQNVTGGGFSCGALTIEAHDLENLLDLTVSTLTNGSDPDLMNAACLCLSPYSEFPGNPDFPSNPYFNSSPSYPNYSNYPANPYFDFPPYSNSLVGHIDPSFTQTVTSCDHFYEFSSVSGNILTGLIYSDGTPSLNCTLTLEFIDNGFEFEDIIQFFNIRPDPDNAVLGVNYNFLIDAKVIVGGTAVVITTLRGNTATCFPIVECTNVADDLSLCNTQIIVPDNDQCVEELTNTAIQNGINAYTTYIEDVIDNFQTSYVDTCLKASDESFTMTYDDQEYDYTLYYYDQAGNLVKTVPPEGISRVDDPSKTTAKIAADYLKITNDRKNDEFTYFSNHRMETKYRYNSLNQLISQSVPDHTTFEDWRISDPTSIDPSLGTSPIADATFTSESNGFFIATDPNDATKSIIYTTTDGGENWDAINGVGIMDLEKVQFLNSTTGYAVGEDGTVISTTDGGVNWDVNYSGSPVSLIDLYFESIPNGLAFDEDGVVYQTTNNAVAWNQLSSIAVDELSAASFDISTRGYVVGTTNGLGEIYKTTNSGTGWSPNAAIRSVDLQAVQFINATVGYAIGVDGTLLKWNNTLMKWIDVLTGTTVDFIDLHFENATDGVVLTASGELLYTTSGGSSFSPSDVSPSLIVGFAEFYFINNTEGFAVEPLNREVYTTVDGGENWIRGGTAPTGILANTIMFEDNVTGYIAGNAGKMSRSINGGAFWSNITGFPSSLNIVRFYYDGTDEEGTAITDNGDVYRTTSAGTGNSWTWTQVTSLTDDYVDFHFIDRDNGFAVAKNGTIASTGNSGQTWSTLTNSPTPSIELAGIFFLNSTDGYVVGKDGDIFTTTDGGSSTWIDGSEDVLPPPLNGVYAQNATLAFAVGDGGTVLYTDNGGAGWRTLPSGTTTKLNAVSVSSTILGYAAGDDAKVVKMESSGGIWSVTTEVFPAGVQAAIAGKKIKDIDVKSGAVFAVAEGGIVLRLQGTWANVSDLVLSSTGLNGVFMFTINEVFAVGIDGTFIRTSNAQTSATWTSPASQFAPGKLNAVNMAADGSNTGYVVGSGGYVLKTENNGTNWTLIASGTTEDLFGVYFVDALKGVIVGDNLTLKFTTDGGISWTDGTIPQVSGTNFPTLASKTLRDVEIDGGFAYVVGDGGVIAKSTVGNLGSWTQKPFPTTAFKDLNSIGLFYDFGYIVGADGTILKNEDTFDPAGSWVRLLEPGGNDWVTFHCNSCTGSQKELNDVFFVDFVTGYIVGNGGIILKTINSGISWDLEISNSTEDLNVITFKTENTAFVGGNNSTGKLITDFTDDISSRFYYDGLGRLVGSQNATQFAMNPQRYTYTQYDALGRIVEVGELASNFEPQPFIDDPNYLATWPGNWSTARTEITVTVYDEEISTAVDAEFGVDGQENLRSRVASVLLYDKFVDIASLFYTYGTHYSYDAHGNVKTLIQDNRELGRLSQRFKRVDYIYDLVSGNVDEIDYQKEKKDQFFHRYVYDSDNRITQLETSSDGVQWDKDASYKYYQHGPLARAEIGDEKVQGIDYAYTIQGLMKGVNSSTLKPTRDIGRDGASGANSLVGVDAYSFSLGYYANDYTAISNPIPLNKFLASTNGDMGTAISTHGGLFNGNIRHMTTTLTDITGAPLQVNGSVYQYDQLNRLVFSNAFLGNYSSIETSNAMASATNNLDYFTHYTYDGNGNMDALERKGNISTGNRNMDDMTFHYAVAGGEKINNQLLMVDDAVDPGFYAEDIDDQGTFDQKDPSTWNYEYDLIGNLTKDKQEEIENIEWTAYGQVKKVERNGSGHANPSSKEDLEFAYDGNGNRIMKLIKPRTAGVLSNQDEWIYTYYVRDASGNIMSTYNRSFANPSGDNYTEAFTLGETPLYGSSGRIGIENRTESMATASFTAATFTEGLFDKSSESISVTNSPGTVITRTLGLKLFELTNHLGNVLATVNDRRIQEQDGVTDNVTSTVVDFFSADIRGVSDYYPFGMQMPDRNENPGDYRFGFNGMEQDQELNGSGNHYTTTWRQYDPRLGRWLSIDPERQQFPGWSPYNFTYNNPIELTDPMGNQVPDVVDQVEPPTEVIEDASPAELNNDNFDFAPGVARRDNTVSIVVPGSGPDPKAGYFTGDGDETLYFEIDGKVTAGIDVGFKATVAGMTVALKGTAAQVTLLGFNAVQKGDNDADWDFSESSFLPYDIYKDGTVKVSQGASVELFVVGVEKSQTFDAKVFTTGSKNLKITDKASFLVFKTSETVDQKTGDITQRIYVTISGEAALVLGAKVSVTFGKERIIKKEDQ